MVRIVNLAAGARGYVVRAIATIVTKRIPQKSAAGRFFPRGPARDAAQGTTRECSSVLFAGTINCVPFFSDRLSRRIDPARLSSRAQHRRPSFAAL